MEDFNPTLEVLDFLKAMWGLKDGPRAFGMRRDQALIEYGAKHTAKDKHLWVKHRKVGNELKVVMEMTSHLDDIKGAGEEEERLRLAKILKRYFGDDLKVNLREFEFTGVKHVQNPDYSIYTHQEHYVQELSTIPIDDLRPDGEADVTESLQTSYMSLLGALMWLLVTRADISPYVSYMQRVAKQPKVKHILMWNPIQKTANY